jgi:hypothetical protein
MNLTIFVLAVTAGLLALDLSEKAPVAAFWWRAAAVSFAIVAGISLAQVLFL